MGEKNSCCTKQHFASNEALLPKSGKGGLAIGLVDWKYCFLAVV